MGSIAPDFFATTTEGPIRFHDCIGDSWAFFFGRSADYTPVCTTDLLPALRERIVAILE